MRLQALHTINFLIALTELVEYLKKAGKEQSPDLSTGESRTSQIAFNIVEKTPQKTGWNCN
jgi:hypothetical protein